jgi:hypothetical protein
MKEGSVAGGMTHMGYWLISVGGNRKLAHRVVWEMHNGPIPPKMVVDHIDGDKKNNKISNLQLLSNKDNCRKQRKRESASKYKGTFIHYANKQGVTRHGARIVIDSQPYIKHGFKSNYLASKAYDRAYIYRLLYNTVDVNLIGKKKPIPVSQEQLNLIKTNAQLYTMNHTYTKYVELVDGPQLGISTREAQMPVKPTKTKTKSKPKKRK